MLWSAKILNKDDGWWLAIKASNGLQGMTNLSEFNGDIIKHAFCKWANDNWSPEKEEAEFSTSYNTPKATIALCIDKFQELAGKDVERDFSTGEIIDVLEKIAQQ